MQNFFQKKSNVLNLIIGILIVVLVGLVAFRVQSLVLDKYFSVSPEEVAEEEVAEEEREEVEEMKTPEFTEEIKERLQKSSGFDFLVSYKDQGFEPFVLEVSLGDTVRFTNNSSQPLKLLKTDKQGNSQTNDCSGADFSVCRMIAVGDFWEITFTEAIPAYYTNGDRRGGEASVVTINPK